MTTGTHDCCEHLRKLWDIYDDAIRAMTQNRVPGIPEEEVLAGKIYVLRWHTGNITVERVDSVEETLLSDGMHYLVDSDGGYSFREDFAASVVAGPLEVREEEE